MTMVVGMFYSLRNAQHAVADLVGSGYSRASISVLVRDGLRSGRQDDDEHGALARAANSISATHVLAGGPLGEALRNEHGGQAEAAVVHTLASAGLQPAAARFFADAICNGAVLVAVHCVEMRVRDARDILDVYAA